MLQSDSDAVLDVKSSSRRERALRARSRRDNPPNPQTLPAVRPLPRWAEGDAADGAGSAFFAGAGIAHLDQLLRAGEGGGEPVFSGALRQRLALKAAATCARLARLREDEAALRDAEHLAGFDAAPTPGGRLHRLWRLFATRPARLDAPLMRAAAECLDLPPDVDCEALAALVHERSTAANPLDAAAQVSAQALHILDDAPQIDAEMFALWLADLVLAQKLGWAAPLPLLATTITHPSIG